MNWKRTLLLILFFLAGVITGTVIGELASHVSWLEWLAWGKAIGVGDPNPVVLDLAVIKLAFGFSVKINFSQIICVIVSLLLYKKFSKGF